MIEFQRKSGPFKIKEIWFSDDVYDVKDVHLVQFRNANFSGDKPGFTKAISTTLILDLTKDLDVIWMGIDKKTTRQKIMRAQEDSTYVIRFNEKYEEYDQINREFRKRKGLPASIISIDDMKKNYFLCIYEKDGVILGGHLSIKDDRRFRQLITCSNMASEGTFSKTVYGRANRLAIWEMIKYAKQEGLVEYDFGGYATGKMAEELKGINEFKKSFGGVECEKYTYTKSYSRLYNSSTWIYDHASNIGYKLRSITKRRAAKEVKGPQENENAPEQKIIDKNS